MFNKLKKWNLNRKLVKEATSKNVNYFKIRDLINQGADFSKIIKYSKFNNFDLTRFIRTKSSNIEIKNLRTFYLKQIENLIYEQYKKNIKKDGSESKKKEAAEKAKSILEKFAIKFNEARIKNINQLVVKEFYLENAQKTAGFFNKILKFISFNRYKTSTEELYIKDIKELESKECMKSVKSTNVKSILKNKRQSNNVLPIEGSLDVLTAKNTQYNTNEKYEPYERGQYARFINQKESQLVPVDNPSPQSELPGTSSQTESQLAFS